MTRTLVFVLCFLVGQVFAAPPSCLTEVGKTRAEAHVEMCRFFSTATHPPCNVTNPCDMMQAEIEKTCTDKTKCAIPKVSGTWKCKDKACSDFSFTPTKTPIK